MDKEEARFILRCFRPDGSDAANPEFSEALQMAAADRELGEWLAKERAQDAEFASMLGTLPLPDDLREEIMAGLAAERGDMPQTDSIDASLIGGLAMVRPPDGLRDDILAAMARSVPSQPVKKGNRWWRIGVPLAAAAGIAFAFVMSSKPDPQDGNSLVNAIPGEGSSVPVSFVESRAIATLDSPDFSLDLKNPDQKVLFNFIRGEGRACPSGCIPKGLKKVKGLGCRVIEVDHKPGSIICFRRGDNEVVHLVVFRRKDVDGELPTCGHPELEQLGDWAAARWEKDNRIFLLLGKTDTEHLSELF